MTKKFYPLFAALVLMISVLAVTSFAQSDIPHQFQGAVTVNGAPAADGTLVVAKVDNVQVAGITTRGGQYGYDPDFFVVPDPYRNRQGKTIEFYVSGVKAAEYVFVNGGRTILDLSVTVSQPPSPPGGTPTGGTIILPPDDEEEGGGGTCTENWMCTDWFECYNGRQSRVCTDLNDCGTEENKPSEQQECYVKICDAGEQRCDGDDLVVCSQNEDSWVLAKTCEDGCLSGLCQSAAGITGLVFDATSIAGIIIVIVVVVGGIAYWKKLR